MDNAKPHNIIGEVIEDNLGFLKDDMDPYSLYDLMVEGLKKEGLHITPIEPRDCQQCFDDGFKEGSTIEPTEAQIEAVSEIIMRVDPQMMEWVSWNKDVTKLATITDKRKEEIRVITKAALTAGNSA